MALNFRKDSRTKEFFKGLLIRSIWREELLGHEMFPKFTSQSHKQENIASPDAETHMYFATCYGHKRPYCIYYLCFEFINYRVKSRGDNSETKLVPNHIYSFEIVYFNSYLFFVFIQ